MTSSAPGKLMLLGEHAVVYGHPCIVTAVNARLSVSVERTESGAVVVDAPQVNNTKFTEAAIKAGCAAWGISHHGLLVKTWSEFPSTYGFGSSSAVTVATLSALASEFDKNVERLDLFRLAYKVILDVQGVGSGFDAAAATYGGTVAYVKGGSRIESFPSAPEIVVGYSGQKADTASIVRDIAVKKEKYPERVDRIFAAVADLVGKAEIALRERDWPRLGTLMNFNQDYLRDLGVSTEKLEAMISAAKSAGAYGAKLSGAGGGDCMIAIVDGKNRDAVEKSIVSVGGEVVHVGVHAVGVGVATTDDQKEMFIVVDESDNILGYRSRAECHSDPALIHRTTGVAVFDGNGRILLQKRSLTKDMDAGSWGMSCAGHVTKGESYEDSAKRELREELGVDIPFGDGKKFLTRDSKETEMAMLFRTVYDGPFRPDPVETSEVRFFSKDELLAMLLSGKEKISSGTVDGLKAIHYL